ncbi:MAG: hypothetical protein RMN24_11670, partial [Anaerolineae bacterium]|nr:hypothetical protein [Anaerolineae bacterium]
FRHELDIAIKNAYLVINRVTGELPAELQGYVARLDFPLLGTVPPDETLTLFELDGRPLVDIPPTAPSYCAVATMMARMLGGG